MKFKGSWQRYNTRRAYLVAAIISFGIGGAVAFIGNAQANPLLILVGFAGLAGGVMLFLNGRKQGDIRIIDQAGEEKGEDYKLPNSLDISASGIKFSFRETPIGQSQKSLNDGKYYNIHKESGEGVEEFLLPDDDESERYYDPTEFANPVTMMSNKKYFTWSASNMQKISIGVMAIVIAAELIGLIAIE